MTEVSEASQSQGSLHFQPGLSLYLLVNSEPRRGATDPGRPSVITAVCVFLLFLMSTSVPGAGRGLATWSQGTGYASAIAISLGDRKYFPRSMDEEIEAKGETSKDFQGGEEPRALRLGPCS